MWPPNATPNSLPACQPSQPADVDGLQLNLDPPAEARTPWRDSRNRLSAERRPSPRIVVRWSSRTTSAGRTSAWVNHPAGDDVVGSNAENFDRRGHYDPNEPLLVRYADVIAARNAVAQLLLVVRQDELTEYRRVTLRGGLAMGVLTVERDLESDAEVDQWLEDLRDRLRGCLPPGGETHFTPIR
jgi:hypothetical protein